MIKHVSIPMVFDYGLLARDVRRARKAMLLTQAELDALLGYQVVANIEAATHARNGYAISMDVFLDVCNALDFNPSDYFCFHDRTYPLPSRKR